MRAGLLRHRVEILSKVVARNEFNEEVIAWTNVVARVWAAVEPLSGREFIEGRQVEADVSTRIRIRHRPGIRPEMRVAWGDRTYTIQAVLDHLDRSRELHLMCTEVA
jgi:SPP1 family predicted phage head-tail adaptor